ncbi:unnamed protein product [Aphanomyces euteiches]|uniref:HIT domain-containing protein n=1 Tax=Aphanomyces euteiches TaxID=100861 RepID=A0A6G0WZM6_9STRA|nr:hypothetical protein Ae201684_009854 [Aphanomyces euteiches]KAH9095841.1 hypothetical protein Ae201684P_010052 [Aphanomyces euteiches]
MEAPECVFCNPIDPGLILYQDELVVAFQDIRPRAAIHVLVIPKQHIQNTSKLTNSHIALVEYMVQVGKTVLADQVDHLQLKSPRKDHIFGFHQAPHNSVDHLHLHCIVPPFAKWWKRYRYSESSWVGHFISAASFINQLHQYR